MLTIDAHKITELAGSHDLSQFFLGLELIFAGENFRGDQPSAISRRAITVGLSDSSCDQRVFATGGHLAGSLAGNHDQFKAVCYVSPETILQQ